MYRPQCFISASTVRFLLCLISTWLQNHNISSIGFLLSKTCAPKTNCCWKVKLWRRWLMELVWCVCKYRGGRWSLATVHNWGFGGPLCLCFCQTLCWSLGQAPGKPFLAPALASVSLAVTAPQLIVTIGLDTRSAYCHTASCKWEGTLYQPRHFTAHTQLTVSHTGLGQITLKSSRLLNAILVLLFAIFTLDCKTVQIDSIWICKHCLFGAHAVIGITAYSIFCACSYKTAGFICDTTSSYRIYTQVVMRNLFSTIRYDSSLFS